MIDIGGPSMLRAAAKNFAHVAPVCRPERYGSILAELRESGQIALETRRALASEAFSRDGRVRGRDRALVRRPRRVPGSADPRLREGDRPRLRREPASARRVLLGGGRAATSALPRRPAARARALVQQPRRPVRGADAHARADRPRLRDRQARQPVRRRGRGHDRGGLRQRARRRSDVGLRRRGRRQPPGRRRARREDRGAVRRGAARARLRRRRARGAPRRSRTRESSSTANDAASTPASATSNACSAGCSSRTATGASRTARPWRSSPASRPRRTGATCSSRGASAST